MKAPDGTPIVGTLEVIPGRADIYYDESGTEWSYDGSTDVWWDEQKTVQRGGQDVFVDEDGNEWLESQLIPDKTRRRTRITPWYHDRDLRHVEIVNTLEALMLRITGVKSPVSECQYLQRAVTLLLTRSEPEGDAP